MLKQANKYRTISFFILLLSSAFAVSQDKKVVGELEKRLHYSILSDYQINGDRYWTSASLSAYVKNVKLIPNDPSDLLTFCISAGYHPNDMFIDDFSMDQLRIISDFDGLLVIYYIGPDGVDDYLSKLLPYDLSKATFEEFKELKGDYILGFVDMTVVREYLKED